MFVGGGDVMPALAPCMRAMRTHTYNDTHIMTCAPANMMLTHPTRPLCSHTSYPPPLHACARTHAHKLRTHTPGNGIRSRRGLTKSIPPKLEAGNFSRSQEWFSESPASPAAQVCCRMRRSGRGAVRWGLLHASRGYVLLHANICF